MHPITEAKLEGILSGKVSLLDLDDNSLLKATDIVDKRVIIHGAWSISSRYRDSVLVMVSVEEQDTAVYVILRGNAGRQAIELHNRRRTPTMRILRKVPLEHGELFTLKMVPS